ncbi:class Ib ribonucleoside-diphosphate reductase assembly flavoprotein NrdI [Aerococcus suis]|uniref:Protein involved in ribonucleotide reduction n=1 Tax=Aerococcus suis TaxID=371602 RepID=A0A1W1Y2U3_9LACT|nr:class Ib ribonucleoside-diphosphate reductase assembly flavoprotein NrdI [Aerococcus suis]MCI7240884.1 class Ib ribonucleoside-diphosphate reductase assembly flavoprotein NrdI [Aerococcus suis]MDD7758931.1 class Ib ribonucleoside-diphosphate reductase assembly flavoprotein NrdI [Aerococcus suis]MDY4647255.1 class Ib ribonucleoside-diphosphate reductase assembly flavoprotein NrdI [Aerococcus suis]SMC30444.1 protein involved in ribonucleotide reduction [Aerococcus suis]
MLVYMSVVGNTRAFVNKVDHPHFEVTEKNCQEATIQEPFIAIIPTYDEGTTEIMWRFMETGDNASYCRGVMGGGNRNFAQLFCYSAKDFAEDFDVPLLHMFEFQGSDYDVKLLEKEIEKIDNSTN